VLFSGCPQKRSDKYNKEQALEKNRDSIWVVFFFAYGSMLHSCHPGYESDESGAHSKCRLTESSNIFFHLTAFFAIMI